MQTTVHTDYESKLWHSGKSNVAGIDEAGRGHLKYLTNLNSATNSPSDEQKIQIITQTFNELYDKNHPVRQNLAGMDEIEEVRIIKGLDR